MLACRRLGYNYPTSSVVILLIRRIFTPIYLFLPSWADNFQLKTFLKTNPCTTNNGGCDQLCFAMPDDGGVACYCHTGMLSQDMKSCEGDVELYDFTHHIILNYNIFDMQLIVIHILMFVMDDKIWFSC